MHQVVTAQLAAKRAGTHSTKTRAEVSGGGAKPWRQKGTGRARQGSIRAPHWRGGGVAHGPKPRDYSQRTPKKMVKLALRSALSDRAAEEKVLVVDDWGITEPKTKTGIQLLEALGLRTKGERDARVLLVLFRGEEDVWKSFRNLGERVQIILPEELNAYDILVNDWLVFSQATLEATVARLTDGAEIESKRSRRRSRRRRNDEPKVTSMSQRDPRDVIIKPVVSEKSYAAYDENVYTFIVAPNANKIEIRKAVEELFGKKVEKVAHHQPQGQAQAQPPHGNVGQPRHSEARHRHPRRRRGSHRHLRELTGWDADRAPHAEGPMRRSGGESNAHSQAQADEPGPPLPVVLRLRGRHEEAAGEVAHEAEAAHRRSQRARQDDRAAPRRRSQAALPPHRLQAEQGRRARQGRRHRVRPEPQRAHRAAALPRRREALHPRPAGPAGRRHAAERPGLRDPPRQRAAAALHPGRHHGAQRRVEARCRRQDGPRRGRRDPAHRQGRRCSRRCGSPPPRCAACRSTAARRSARSATARPV